MDWLYNISMYCRLENHLTLNNRLVINKKISNILNQLHFNKKNIIFNYKTSFFHPCILSPSQYEALDFNNEPLNNVFSKLICEETHNHQQPLMSSHLSQRAGKRQSEQPFIPLSSLGFIHLFLFFPRSLSLLLTFPP